MGQTWETTHQAGKWGVGVLEEGCHGNRGSERGWHPENAAGYRKPGRGMGWWRPIGLSTSHRARATNLSARRCQWSRGSSCVSPNPVQSKHKGRPAPTTRAVAFSAWLGRQSSILPSPPFLLSSQLGQFSISILHPLVNPILPLAAGQCSEAIAPTPIPPAPTTPPPPNRRGCWDLAPPFSVLPI